MKEQHYVENEAWQIWDGDKRYPLKDNQRVMFKLDAELQIVTNGPADSLGLDRERAELIVSAPAMKNELEKSVEIMENLLLNYGYLMSFREKDTLQERIKQAQIALEGRYL